MGSVIDNDNWGWIWQSQGWHIGGIDVMIWYVIDIWCCFGANNIPDRWYMWSVRSPTFSVEQTANLLLFWHKGKLWEMDISKHFFWDSSLASRLEFYWLFVWILLNYTTNTRRVNSCLTRLPVEYPNQMSWIQTVYRPLDPATVGSIQKIT